MRIALMTGGGDAPGLNGIIESVSRTLLRKNVQVIGIRNGFDGIFNGHFLEIKEKDILGLHAQAGTFLGTSNKSPLEGREKEFISGVQSLNCDGLIVAGGDGTFRALSLYKDHLNIIAVPKTIDNDIPGTDVTFGFDTACSVVAESVDSLLFTARAHKRVFIVETMGRNTGWIALGSGLSSYADIILIPEIPYQKQKLRNYILEKKKTRSELMIVIAEGAHAEGESSIVSHYVPGSPQAERFGGISEKLARWIEEETGWESRHVILGHLQRSRAPTVTDRFLTLSMGALAANLALEKKWNQAVVYREGLLKNVPVTEVMGEDRKVNSDHRWIKLADHIGIYTGK